MQFHIVFAICLLLAVSGCTGSVPDARESDGPVTGPERKSQSEPTAGENNHVEMDAGDVETILRGSTGVALLRIEKFKEVDARSACGPLSLSINSKILESFGTVAEDFEIYLASAGNGPPNAPPDPKPILDPKQIAVGKSYWIAFYCDSVVVLPVGAWPGDSKIVREQIANLESTSDFRWKIVTSPKE